MVSRRVSVFVRHVMSCLLLVRALVIQVVVRRAGGNLVVLGNTTDIFEHVKNKEFFFFSYFTCGIAAPCTWSAPAGCASTGWGLRVVEHWFHHTDKTADALRIYASPLGCPTAFRGQLLRTRVSGIEESRRGYRAVRVPWEDGVAGFSFKGFPRASSRWLWFPFPRFPYCINF